METFIKKYKRSVVILILIGLAFALGLTWRWIEGTPQYIIYRIGSSLKNRDCETFLSYVDLDNILKQQVEIIRASGGGQNHPDSRGSERVGRPRSAGTGKIFKKPE
jgi:hypothetical protein